LLLDTRTFLFQSDSFKSYVADPKIIFLCPLRTGSFLKLILIPVLETLIGKLLVTVRFLCNYVGSPHDQLHGHVDFYRTAFKRTWATGILDTYSEVMISFVRFYICHVFEHGSEQTFCENLKNAQVAAESLSQCFLKPFFQIVILFRPHMNSVCSNAGDSSIADEVSEVLNSLRKEENFIS
jgi:hypothetical protein